MDDIDIKSCEHEEVDDGYCITCGLKVHLQNYSDEVQYTELHQRAAQDTYLGFDNDLKDIDLPEEVKNWILNKAKNAPKKTHRMSNRTKILFAYTYMAYLQLGYNFQPEELVKVIGIEKKDVSAALRMVSGTSPIVLPQADNDRQIIPLVVISPMVYIPDVCRHIEMEEHIPNLKSLCERALKGNRMLFEEEPRWVAIALLKYYMDNICRSYPKFYKKFGVDCTSIKKCVVKIKEVLDKDIQQWKESQQQLLQQQQVELQP